MQLLGLTHRKNTIVGNELLRGVSGGEKKRVTIGVECMKDPAVWLLDEPTTGLDASAAYEVMRTMRTICDMGTYLFSMLQGCNHIDLHYETHSQALRYLQPCYNLRMSYSVFSTTSC